MLGSDNTILLFFVMVTVSNESHNFLQWLGWKTWQTRWTPTNHTLPSYMVQVIWKTVPETADSTNNIISLSLHHFYDGTHHRSCETLQEKAKKSDMLVFLLRCCKGFQMLHSRLSLLSNGGAANSMAIFPHSFHQSTKVKPVANVLQ